MRLREIRPVISCGSFLPSKQPDGFAFYARWQAEKMTKRSSRLQAQFAEVTKARWAQQAADTGTSTAEPADVAMPDVPQEDEPPDLACCSPEVTAPALSRG